MRFSAIFYVIISTLLLVGVVGMIFYNVSFEVIFYTVLAGQVWWLLTVYKVITDKYATKKEFEDWYEDHPIGRE